MRWWNNIVFLLAITRIPGSYGSILFKIPNHTDDILHENIAVQVYEDLGLKQGNEAHGNVRVFDDNEYRVLCEIVAKVQAASDEEISEMQVGTQGKKNETFFVFDPFRSLNCTSESEIFFVLILPILVDFWETNFIFVLEERSVPYMLHYARAVRNPLYRRQVLNPLDRAFLFTKISSQLTDFRELFLHSNTDQQTQFWADLNAIDRNELLDMFDSFLFRAFFQGIYPLFSFYTLYRAISVYKARKRRPGDWQILMVLRITIFASLLIGLILLLDGYGSRGDFSANWANSFRGLFFGLNCAADFLMGSGWLSIVHQSNFNETSHRCTQCVFLLGTILLLLLDVVTVLCFTVLHVEWQTLFFVFPSIAIISQLLLIPFLLISTGKVLHVFRPTETKNTSIMKDEVETHILKRNRVQELVVRRHAIWIRVSMICSFFFLVAYACVALQSFYLTNKVLYATINSLLISARLGCMYSKTQFCAPPPKTIAIASSLTISEQSHDFLS